MPGAERAENPLEARIVDRPQREDDDGSRKDDLVRDQPGLEVGPRHDHEHPAEDSRGDEPRA